MTVRCEQDRTTFEAKVERYRQPTGLQYFLECPTCHRLYFLVNSTPEQWFADRLLTILD